MTFIHCLSFGPESCQLFLQQRQANPVIPCLKDFSQPWPGKDNIHRKILSSISTGEAQPMFSCLSKTKEGGNFGYWSSAEAVLTMGLSVCMLRGNKSIARKALTAPLQGAAPQCGRSNSIRRNLNSLLPVFVALLPYCMDSVIYKLFQQQKILHIYMNICILHHIF